VQGVASKPLIISSKELAVSLFYGYCIPWVMMVDSKATIGKFYDKAY
jgi:hypothetical protein